MKFSWLLKRKKASKSKNTRYGSITSRSASSRIAIDGSHLYLLLSPLPTTFINMNYSPADISGLISLIVNAASSLEGYHKDNLEKPYVPSLDDIEPHPLDAEVYPLQMKQAAQTLEGACAQLCATLIRPNHTVLNVSLS